MNDERGTNSRRWSTRRSTAEEDVMSSTLPVFALDLNRVAKADRLGCGELDAGDQVLEKGISGERRHDTCEPGHPEQAEADLTSRFERHQRQAGSNEDDHHISAALQDTHLRLVGARHGIVGGLTVEPLQVELGAHFGGIDRGPSDKSNNGHHEQLAEHVAKPGGGHHRHDEPDREQDECEPGGSGGVSEQRFHNRMGVTHGPSREPHEDPVGPHGDEDREDHRAAGNHPIGHPLEHRPHGREEGLDSPVLHHLHHRRS
jgi:hypothetical protein